MGGTWKNPGAETYPTPAYLASLGSDERARRLAEIARDVRRSALQMIGTARLGHVGGDFSVADIMTTAFFAVMRSDPTNPEWADRDRFILSKGHCAASLYSVLAMRGYFPIDWLPTFMQPLSILNGHPNRKIPGVEANTGPLGHGLPIGVGSALASRLSGRNWRTFVVLGDGELQEGSNWEAAMAAGHNGLDTLFAVVDRNRLQQGAGTEETNRLDPLAEKWAAFGWETVEVDGHDHAALYDVLARPGRGKPVAVIANTTKGKGVSFMEGGVEWHHKVPSPEQIKLAFEELAR